MQLATFATPCRAALVSIALLAAPAVAFAQPDVSGLWDLTSEISLVPEGAPCSFAGMADVQQTGSEFSGTADLDLVSGPAECPQQMDAGLFGSITADGAFEGAGLEGSLGSASFDGGVGAVPADGGENEAGGGLDVISGNFAGSTGSWSAVLGAPPVVAIPTLAPWGLLLLIAVLGATALWSVRRRRVA